MHQKYDDYDDIDGIPPLSEALADLQDLKLDVLFAYVQAGIPLTKGDLDDLVQDWIKHYDELDINEHFYFHTYVNEDKGTGEIAIAPKTDEAVKAIIVYDNLFNAALNDDEDDDDEDGDYPANDRSWKPWRN